METGEAAVPWHWKEVQGAHAAQPSELPEHCRAGQTYAGTVGVNWGRVANDLPSPAAAQQLLKQHGIAQVKLYDTEPAVLRALANSGIKVVVALPNEQVAAAARRPSYALAWVRRNVAAYYPATQIQGIAVGNEVFATAANVTAQLVPAMINVHAALARLSMDKAVKVSSPSRSPRSLTRTRRPPACSGRSSRSR
ncbi:hypothetical protein ZWY2020_022714 [Hordeum vulgare]|nr:hypothetical protein ZWY2020_022714 [Hordeum vulgare]